MEHYSFSRAKGKNQGTKQEVDDQFEGIKSEKYPAKIGLTIWFSARSMGWALLEEGQTWNATTFCLDYAPLIHKFCTNKRKVSFKKFQMGFEVFDVNKVVFSHDTPLDSPPK